MVIAQEGRRSIGSNDPLPQRAISPHVQPKSAPMASDDAQPGVSPGFGKNPPYRRMRSIKQLGNLVKRFTLAPALPHQGLLAFRIVDPWSLLHLQHSLCLRKDYCVASTG